MVTALAVVEGVPVPVTCIPVVTPVVLTDAAVKPPAVVFDKVTVTAVSVPQFVVMSMVLLGPRPSFENMYSSPVCDNLQDV
jgi:hypothetical protein